MHAITHGTSEMVGGALHLGAMISSSYKLCIASTAADHHRPIVPEGIDTAMVTIE